MRNPQISILLLGILCSFDFQNKSDKSKKIKRKKENYSFHSTLLITYIHGTDVRDAGDFICLAGGREGGRNSIQVGESFAMEET